jgi:HEAT repeat protein
MLMTLRSNTNTMIIESLINDKSIKPKEKTESLSKFLLENPLIVNELVNFARQSKDPAKATCIEALEFATASNPGIATMECFNFVIHALTEKAPRVKWEAARVIGNIAHLYPAELEKAIINLLINTENPGTVVRWSAATALGKILKLKTSNNIELIPAIEAIAEREEKNSIRKIYLEALTSIRK